MNASTGPRDVSGNGNHATVLGNVTQAEGLFGDEKGSYNFTG